jgi:hypothetical protein
MLVGSAMALTTIATHRSSLMAQSTPAASPASSGGEYPELLIVVSDTGFDVPQPLAAARYRVTVRNDGTQPSHTGFGLLPDGATMDDFEQMGVDVSAKVNGHSFMEIGFVGLPDWPAPGGEVTGYIDLGPGNYVVFDPIGPRSASIITVDGTMATAPDPHADVTVELAEMSITFPSLKLSAGKQTWKVANKGALIHELAVMPVSESLTEDELMQIFMLPEDATPAPGQPTLEYDPKAAVGVLGPQRTSWLDVDLATGRYLAICMVPIPGPMPHGMEGMLAFIELS